MNVGLNIGYSHTKGVGSTSGDIRTVRFPSVVGSPDEVHWSPSGDEVAKHIDNGSAQSIRLIEPEPALIGDEAIIQSRFVHRREDRAWTGSREWYLLSLAALSELTRSSTTLRVVTGLPVAYYSDKAEVEQALTGVHRVRQHGRNTQTITIDKVTVIPEPYGTLFDQLWTDRGGTADAEVATGQFGIIDAGGKTTNLLTVDRIREIGRNTTSIPVGVWDAARAMRSHLEQFCPGLELRDHQVVQTLIDGWVKYRGERVDLGRTAADILSNLAGQIANQVTQLWSSANLDGILITGGGALLFGEYLTDHIDLTRVRVVDDPVLANARGFWKYAQYLETRA